MLFIIDDFGSKRSLEAGEWRKEYLGSSAIMYDKKTISSPVDPNEYCEVTRARREYTTHAKYARARVSTVVLQVFYTPHIFN